MNNFFHRWYVLSLYFSLLIIVITMHTRLSSYRPRTKLVEGARVPLDRDEVPNATPYHLVAVMAYWHPSIHCTCGLPHDPIDRDHLVKLLTQRYPNYIVVMHCRKWVVWTNYSIKRAHRTPSNKQAWENVRWDCLLEALQHMGFGPIQGGEDWFRYVMLCLQPYHIALAPQ